MRREIEENPIFRYGKLEGAGEIIEVLRGKIPAEILLNAWTDWLAAHEAPSALDTIPSPQKYVATGNGGAMPIWDKVSKL